MKTEPNLLTRLSTNTETNEESKAKEEDFTKPPSEPSSKTKSKSYIIISNTALILWAVFLAVVGIQAVNKKASKIILNFPSNLYPPEQTSVAPSTSANSGMCEDVSHELNEFIKNRYRRKEDGLIPPIATVLDLLQVNANWREPSKLSDNKDKLTCTYYRTLFSAIADRLDSIVAVSPVRSEPQIITIASSIIPKDFRPKGAKPEDYTNKVEMPVEVTLWVQRSQKKNQEIKDATSFLDLFVLLIILGGFGSWVYLIRLHLDDSQKVKLEAYFYRPVLGMALAIAVFIINLSLHSLVSSSGIEQVRHETLILLAFTAGLLSDKTYKLIEDVTQEEMDKRTRQKNSMKSENNTEFISNF
ncbi:MAG: hypothetical protein ACRC8Y_24015 [Chroococcales cyanobacterium]